MNANSTAPEGKRAFTAESLPDHPLFRGLSGRHRQILADCSMHASFSAGEVVVETGEPANCFYLVVSGSIGLETLGARAPLRVQTIGPGDILGWSWLFPPYYWHFNAIADEPTEAIFFYGSRLCQECDRDPDLGYELFKRMAQRHRGCNATPMAAGGISTGSFPLKTDCGRNSSPSLVRGNMDSFAIKTDTSKLLQRIRDQFANCRPQILLDTAKVAIKRVSSAGKSLITGEPFVPLSPMTRPPASSPEREN